MPLPRSAYGTFSMKELTTRWGCHPDTVLREYMQKGLKGTRCGDRWFFTWEDVDDFEHSALLGDTLKRTTWLVRRIRGVAVPLIDKRSNYHVVKELLKKLEPIVKDLRKFQKQMDAA